MTQVTAARTASRRRTVVGALFAALASLMVGSAVPASEIITDAPLFLAQGLRYALAAVALVIVARVAGWKLPRPRGREWAWLAGTSLSGLVLFNVAMVRGVEHADPAVIGVAVAVVPVLLALAGPMFSRSRPSMTAVIGAVVVTGGAIIVTGAGRADAIGIGLAIMTLVCASGFTLFAVPVLDRIGATGVSFHVAWMAAAGLVALSLVTEGPRAVLTLRPDHLAAMVYLALIATVVTFLLWYTAVDRIGPDGAGLFNGVTPVASALGAVLLGAAFPGPMVWVGLLVVAAGIAIGLGVGHRTP